MSRDGGALASVHFVVNNSRSIISTTTSKMLGQIKTQHLMLIVFSLLQDSRYFFLSSIFKVSVFLFLVCHTTSVLRENLYHAVLLIWSNCFVERFSCTEYNSSLVPQSHTCHPRILYK